MTDIPNNQDQDSILSKNTPNEPKPQLSPTNPPSPSNIEPQKIKFPPFFWNKSQELIKEIEQKTSSKVLVYYMESGSSINNDDVDYFYSHVKELQSDIPITLVLVSSGGSGMAAWRIANVLKKYCSSLTVAVVSRCASAATLLSLSADKMLFGPAGYLTAIDTSLVHPLNPKSSERDEPSSVSVDQINKIKQFIEDDLKNHPSTKSVSEILFDKIHPVVLGELVRTSNLSKLIAKNMLGLRNTPPTEEEGNKIIDILNDSFPAHGYPIVSKEAQKIGLPAEDMPEELSSLYWELIKLYSLVSKKTITNFNPDFYHFEGIPVLIESVGRRTFYALSYNKRFKNTWSVENDKSGWLSAIYNPESPDKPKISSIEV